MAARTLPQPGSDVNREERRGEIHPLDVVALGVISNRMPRDPDSGPCVLCLDLGAATGWALRSTDGVITSGTAAFRVDRWTGGGMRFLRFKRWLTEVKNAADGLDQVFYEAVLATKQAFPGATITAVRERKPIDWAKGDEIPF